MVPEKVGNFSEKKNETFKLQSLYIHWTDNGFCSDAWLSRGFRRRRGGVRVWNYMPVVLDEKSFQ